MGGAKRIVICGGGAIGAAIAYFLSRRGARPIVVERHAVAGAASGKSGGFLALDWCRGTPLDRLARRSFALHAELAEALGNPWGYRRLDDLCRSCRRDRHGTQRERAAVALRTGGDHGPARLAADDGAGRAARLHHGPDARRRGEGADAAARHGRRAGAPAERRRAAASRSTAARPSRATPWSSPWDRGRSWRRAGCRCPRCTATRATAWCSGPASPFPRRRCSSNTRRPSGEVLTPELFPRADGTTWVCAVSSDRSAAGRSGPGRRRRRRACAARGDVPDDLAGAGRGCDRGAPGVLPAGHRGRAAADRRGAGRRRRLRGDRAQRLGHAERAGDRRGDGRADPRRRRRARSTWRLSRPGGCGPFDPARLRGA